MESEKKSYSIMGAALERCDGDAEKAAPIAMENAGWRLEKIAELQSERARVEARRMQTEFWASAQTDKLNQEILRHTYLLDGFYGDLPPAKGKSIVLPEGKISRRVTKPKTEKSEEAALRWLRENLPEQMDAFLELRDPKVLWKALREHIVYDDDGRAVWTATGEVMEVPVSYESYDTGSGEVVKETDMVPVLQEVQPARPYTVQVQPLGGDKESPWEPDDEGLFGDEGEDSTDIDLHQAMSAEQTRSDMAAGFDGVPTNLFE